MKRMIKAIPLCLMGVGVAVLASIATNPSGGLWGKSFLYQSQPVNVVKVTVDHGNEADVGSGSLVRGDLILTCYHVVRDYRAGDTINIEFETGLEREGTIVKVDGVWDLAVIRIKPVLYPVVRPAAKGVMKSQTVNICGFPHGREYGEVRGRVYNFRSPTPRTPNHIFTVNKKTVSGMSGGPVFNDGGELVGVLFGSQRYSNCTGLPAIKNFLKGVE